MTELAVVACVAIVALAVALVVLVVAQVRERARWADERRQLTDRAIARHSGEVIAFDRAQKPRPERDPRPVLEGVE